MILLSSLFKVRQVAQDLDCRKDITELHKAVGAFVFDPRLGGVAYMPSTFSPGGTDANSATYISRVFPKATNGQLNVASAPAGGSMQGHQCLVFFLQGPNGTGWSTNPRDPTATGGERIGPFYDFKPQRVGDTLTDGFPSYIDVFKSRPIAYFSSSNDGSFVDPYVGSLTDNQGLEGGFAPYKGVNVTTWQIISAGRDKKFGVKGAFWGQQAPNALYPMGDQGFDDVANFATGLLGSMK